MFALFLVWSFIELSSLIIATHVIELEYAFVEPEGLPMISRLHLLFTVSLLCFSVVFTPRLSIAENTDAYTSGQPDLEREKRLVAEIEDGIFDGEVIFLDAAGDTSNHEFMAIDMEPDDEVRGGVILLHGRGYHADWEYVINPVRVKLAEEGWRTLSLQMPVLEKDAKYYDYVPLFDDAHPRIEAAIAHLTAQGVNNIVLFSHSCGVHMAMDWVRDNGDGDISAFIGVGMGATDYRQKMAKPFPLDDMKAPVLDIYGSKEFKGVLRMAPERLAAIKKANHPKSDQQVVEGANHYFNTEEQGEALGEAVSAWLDTLKEE